MFLAMNILYAHNMFRYFVYTYLFSIVWVVLLVGDTFKLVDFAKYCVYLYSNAVSVSVIHLLSVYCKGIKPCTPMDPYKVYTCI